MSNYLYLFSDKLSVSATSEKPGDVTVSGGKWKVRCFEFNVGEAVTVYTDDPWEGTLGVYHMDDPSHILLALEHMRKHSLALLQNRAEYEISKIMGEEAALDLWTMRCCPKPESDLCERGKLLWCISNKLNGLCFRGE